MECLYCSYLEIAEPAVGLCRCGAALCRDHLFEQLATRRYMRTVGPVSRTVPLGPTERRLLCPACAPAGARRVATLDPVD
jgi:hypothetical protein